MLEYETDIALTDTALKRIVAIEQNPPVVRPYRQGSWGPNQIHQLVAPYAWRLPFERQWRNPNAMGG